MVRGAVERRRKHVIETGPLEVRWSQLTPGIQVRTGDRGHRPFDAQRAGAQAGPAPGHRNPVSKRGVGQGRLGVSGEVGEVGRLLVEDAHLRVAGLRPQPMHPDRDAGAVQRVGHLDGTSRRNGLEGVAVSRVTSDLVELECSLPRRRIDRDRARRVRVDPAIAVVHDRHPEAHPSPVAAWPMVIEGQEHLLLREDDLAARQLVRAGRADGDEWARRIPVHEVRKEDRGAVVADVLDDDR